MSLTCFMTSQLSSVNGLAEEDCTLLVVPAGVIDELFGKYPSWKKYVMSTILGRFSELVKSIDEVAFKKMDERLIKYLKEKSKISGSAVLNLTHQQIGDDLGTNRVVISRLLKKMEEDKKLLLLNKQIKLFKDL